VKKPLLLLVDDDRAVLDALEAELTPEFSQLCRLEAFDDPGAVLRELPRWSVESRAIAVAIVDQKMPLMSGIELLSAFRGAESTEGEFLPTRHTRSILLTGYAGLDSALGSKNLASVDRYLEKPWSSAELHRQVRQLLRRHHHQAASDRHLLFRELIRPDELRMQFKLRYEVYSRSPDLAHLLRPNASRIAVDAYDVVSRQFGLMRADSAGEAPAGGIRVIGEESAATAHVVAIAQEDAVVRREVAQERSYPIEIPLKHAQPGAIVEFINARLAAGERLVEMGRLILAQEQRGTGLAPSQAAFAILESTGAEVGFHQQIPNSVMHCSIRHGPAYTALGFRPMPGTRASYSEFIRDNVVLLWARPEWVPQPARGHMMASARAIERTGAACRCAAFPACIGGPHETGDFRAVDIACPRLAVELTAPAPLVLQRDPSGAEFEE
jgi:CheY-like chemotaxis protein